MANTNMDSLFPEFWSSYWSELKLGEYNFQNQVSRDAEGLVAEYGDTVNVPVETDLGEADEWVDGADITATDITQVTQQVVLNKSFRKTIALTSKDRSLSPYKLQEKYANSLMKPLLRSVNKELYLESMKTSNWIDSVSALDEDDLVDAGTGMDNKEVSSENRKLIAGPTDFGRLLKLDAFQHADVSGSPDAMRDGSLGRKFGFDIFKNNIISTYTPADVTGAVNNKGAAYAAGTTTIAVDGINDDANPIRPGDIFVIADETNTPYHTVVSTTTTNSDTTGITFTPAIVDGAADDAGITVTPTRSLICMVPAALALAARSYAPIEEAGVRTQVANFMGLPIRIVTWLNPTNLKINIQYDILFGMKLIDSDRVYRIITA